jgi:hypothetical protein
VEVRFVAKKAARGANKRDRVKGPGGDQFAKRTASGRFKEMDDAGRSQKADRRTKATTTVRSGFGDQGDQKKTKRKSR